MQLKKLIIQNVPRGAAVVGAGSRRSLELRAAGPTTNRERRAPAGPAAAERPPPGVMGPPAPPATGHSTMNMKEKLNQHMDPMGRLLDRPSCAGGVARGGSVTLCACRCRRPQRQRVTPRAQRWW